MDITILEIHHVTKKFFLTGHIPQNPVNSDLSHISHFRTQPSVDIDVYIQILMWEDANKRKIWSSGGVSQKGIRTLVQHLC